MKRIDVLCACWQGERYLPAQLASLQAQDDPCFRVILGDDGSTDGTCGLIDAVCKADSRFAKAAPHPEQLGAIGNFWAMLSADDAPYTALSDQDDVWLPEHLSACRRAMADAEARWGEATPLLVHGDCIVTDEHGCTLHDSFFAHQGWDAAAVTLPRLLVQNNLTGCTCLMNAALRRLAVAHGDPSKMVMHDWFLALTAAAFGHVVFVPQPLVRYRQHGRNVKGASGQGLGVRGVKALSRWERGKARIALTYRHTADFRDAFGDTLPKDARACIDAYLATEALPKPRRLRALIRGGYLMQSRITRMGQMIFG